MATYLPPGPDPGPGYYGNPRIGWTDDPNDRRYQGANPTGGGGDTRSEDQYIQEALDGPFGATVQVFASIPELRPLIAQMASTGRDANWFLAQARQTNWWKQTSQAGQEWLGISPQEREIRTEQMAARISDWYVENAGRAWSVQTGYSNPYGDLVRSQAEKIANGTVPWELWTVAAYQQVIAVEGSPLQVAELQKQEQLARAKKRPQEIAEELWQQARGDYFVNVSKEAATDWATKIINGQSSYGEYNDYLRAAASQQFKFYEKSIGNGILPKSLFSPMLELAANEYGTSTDGIIANDRLWGQIIQSASGAAGTTGMPTTSEWIKYLRSQPEWNKTQKGQKYGLDLAQTFAKAFGESAI